MLNYTLGTIEASEALIKDLYIDLRAKVNAWSKITQQTPQARMGYVGQHLVSVVTGYPGGKSGARGYDLVIDDERHGEIKTCYRVDQLGSCNACGAVVSSLETECAVCRSTSINRKDDSKWLIAIRNNDEFAKLLDPYRYYFVLFEFESIYDSNNNDIIASIWEVDPKSKGFAYCMIDYYLNIRSQSTSKAPFNMWPHVPYDTSPALLCFDFAQTDTLPYRINILIGKNGTGKTQTLSRLANSLSGYTDALEAGAFVDRRPPVDKVMSISYSAFDCFRKPPEGTDSRSVFSYVYCGIQSEQGTLSLPQLKENLKRAFLTIKERGRQEIWNRVLSELMEAEHQRTLELISAERFNEVNLSSGQQILICTITELIANIENESIILFDEPEIHLHPNAIANMVRMFYRLLDEFNSYAIFSTHSPLILQEIPSKYIQILDRVDNSLNVRKPDIECFGNNISEIVFDVFDVTSVESNFKSHLRKLSQNKSYNDILELFDGNLSLNALIFLKSCYMGGD